MVLEERLALFEYAVNNYEDGLLFFYFSSSDLQSHIFWWDSDAKHPIRSDLEAKARFEQVRRLYQKLDSVIGDLVDRYGGKATIIVMSDHGFANFGRQFNLNSWLRDWGYLGPRECTSIMHDVDWSLTTAYGLGINGLYLNMKGRERDGIVEPGEQREALLLELKERLEAMTDDRGERVIRGVYRSDQIYKGNATGLAPDIIIGYARGYRASWATCLGDLTGEVLLDNDSAWSADHCADALEVPGVLFCNRHVSGKSPSLVDIAPSILAEFGLPIPPSMVGKNAFADS
jgi:predicted AlkP superfamily phosphohydrolase/phosphomutase